MERMNKGTWLGVNTKGLVVGLTNYWEDQSTEAQFNATPSAPMDSGLLGYRTRGSVPLSLLRKGAVLEEVVSDLRAHRGLYKSFNLMCADLKTKEGCYFGVNQSTFIEPQPLQSGVHCISNAELDGDWQKVQQLKAALSDYLNSTEAISVESLMALLGDSNPNLPIRYLKDSDTAIFVTPYEEEQFGAMQHIGTVSSTVVLCNRDNQVSVTERTFQVDQRQYHDTLLEFLMTE